MEVDYGAWRFWLDLLQLAGVIAIGVYTWVVNRTKANRDSIEHVDATVGKLNDRVTVIENEIKHLPGEPEVGRIHNRIDQVGQGVRHIEGEMKQMNATLHLIQQYLLENGK